MNKERRKRLQEVVDKLLDIQSELEAVKDEEQECYDNMPEGLQASSRGEEMEENVSYLEDAIEETDGLIESINQILDR